MKCTHVGRGEESSFPPSPSPDRRKAAHAGHETQTQMAWPRGGQG